MTLLSTQIIIINRLETEDLFILIYSLERELQMRWRTEISLPSLSLSSHPHRDPLFQAAKCVLYLPGCVGTREIARARIEVDLMPETRPLPKLVSTELKHWVKKQCLLGPRRSHCSCLCSKEDAVLHKADPSDFVE